MLERNRELIEKATKTDFNYVMSMSGLTRHDIYNYKTGRSKRNILTIENLLLKSISNRKNLEKKHLKRIKNVLYNKVNDPFEDVVKKRLSSKIR